MAEAFRGAERVPVGSAGRSKTHGEDRLRHARPLLVEQTTLSWIFAAALTILVGVPFNVHRMTTLGHLIYVSEATVDFSDREVRELLERARRHNASVGVTGILLLVGRSFFQVLEGAPEAVTKLYEKIGHDKRHRRVVKLIEEAADDRDFPDWSMGLARVTSKELADLPGLSDFFATRRSLDSIGEGLARTLLSAFRDGRFRAHVGD